MVTLHIFTGINYLRGIPVYRYLLECDGYDLGHFETYKQLNDKDVIKLMFKNAIATSTNFTEFKGYALSNNIKYNCFKVSDETISEFLKRKKKFQINSRLKELKVDFK